MLILLEISSFAVDREKNIPLVVLKEQQGERVFSVPIQSFEAGAIAIRTLNVIPRKPLTIDLIHVILTELGGELSRIVLYDIINNSIQARLHVSQGKKISLIDCSISDAIALALRSDTPLYATEDVLIAKCVSGEKKKTPSIKQIIKKKNTLHFGEYFLE